MGIPPNFQLKILAAKVAALEPIIWSCLSVCVCLLVLAKIEIYLLPFKCHILINLYCNYPPARSAGGY